MSWKDTAGIPETTTKIQIYCPETQKTAWNNEVEEKNYKSLSTYLYELIQEARAYRDQGFLAHHQSEQKIQALEQEVNRLQNKLNEQEKGNSGQVELDDNDFLYRFLSTQYKPLEQILREIVESGVLDDLIRKRVENQLYYMASQDHITYQRGHGWKLNLGGDE